MSNFFGIDRSGERFRPATGEMLQKSDERVRPDSDKGQGELQKSHPLSIFAPLVKVDASSREVHGVLAEEAPDRSGEIFDYTSSKPHVKQWSDDAVSRSLATGQEISYGNVRGQHSGNIAAGKLTKIEFDDRNKKIFVVAKIADPVEWRKVIEGVYTGFSIGGGYLKKWKEGLRTRYTAKPYEVSLVDNPCMYGATFSMVKADGSHERMLFKVNVASLELAQFRADARAQIEALTKRVLSILESRGCASTNEPGPRFRANEPENSLAKATLDEALRNPVLPSQHDLQKGVSKFQTLDTSRNRADGSCLDAVEETNSAQPSLRKALNEGRPAFKPR